VLKTADRAKKKVHQDALWLETDGSEAHLEEAAKSFVTRERIRKIEAKESEQDAAPLRVRANERV